MSLASRTSIGKMFVVDLDEILETEVFEDTKVYGFSAKTYVEFYFRRPGEAFERHIYKNRVFSKRSSAVNFLDRQRNRRIKTWKSKIAKIQDQIDAEAAKVF